LNDPIPRF